MKDDVLSRLKTEIQIAEYAYKERTTVNVQLLRDAVKALEQQKRN